MSQIQINPFTENHTREKTQKNAEKNSRCTACCTLSFHQKCSITLKMHHFSARAPPTRTSSRFYNAPSAAVSWVKKVSETGSCKFPIRKIMSAQNFYFAPNCPLNKGFSLTNFAFLNDKFPTTRTFSDNFPTA